MRHPKQDKAPGLASTSALGLGKELRHLFGLAKAWSVAAGSPEIGLSEFLEAAVRRCPEVLSEAFQAAHYPSHATEAVSRSAASRPVERDSRRAGRKPMPICRLLNRSVVAAREKGSGEVTVKGTLAELCGDREFKAWFLEHYPHRESSAVGIRAWIELLGRHYGLLFGASSGEANAAGELQRLRAEAERAWWATPRNAPLRRLYANWGLEPLSPRALAVEVCLVDLLQARAQPRRIQMLIPKALELNYSVRELLEGVENGVGLGLLRRISPSGVPTLLDHILATDGLAVDLSEALAHEPISPAEIERARLYLSAR